ncbi:hypothetical protein [Pantoea ananatis]
MENNKLSDVNSKSGSELIAIAHGIAANFESPATELLRELASRLDCAIVRGDELQQKLDALAVENAAKDSAINEVLRKRPGGVYFNKCEDLLLNAVNSPVTDAYLNSVRAEGVEILTSRLQQLIDDGVFDVKEIGVAAGAVHEGAQIAASLRSGTHDTADKAG